jgi:hypothetical protein
MSTIFGVLKEYVDPSKIVDEDGELLWYISKNAFEPVFFRSMRQSRWLNWAGAKWSGAYMNDDTIVYALDNTRQGIYTIKDCKELLKKEQNEGTVY